MAHQKYLNWATMATHFKHAHNQWMRMVCQGLEEAYLASFHKVSHHYGRNRTIKGETPATIAALGKGARNNPSPPARPPQVSINTADAGSTVGDTVRPLVNEYLTSKGTLPCGMLTY